jgi:hypothetical protein
MPNPVIWSILLPSCDILPNFVLTYEYLTTEDETSLTQDMIHDPMQVNKQNTFSNVMYRTWNITIIDIDSGT